MQSLCVCVHVSLLPGYYNNHLDCVLLNLQCWQFNFLPVVKSHAAGSWHHQYFSDHCYSVVRTCHLWGRKVKKFHLVGLSIRYSIGLSGTLLNPLGLENSLEISISEVFLWGCFVLGLSRAGKTKEGLSARISLVFLLPALIKTRQHRGVWRFRSASNIFGAALPTNCLAAYHSLSMEHGAPLARGIESVLAEVSMLNMLLCSAGKQIFKK